MKKQFLFILTAFVVQCQGLKAQNTGEMRYLNLVLPNNSVISYGLTDGVDIHFQDSIMVVNELSFYMEDLVKYYFSVDDNADIYTIIVAANPIEGGIVSQSGNGIYAYGETCTLTATANPSYSFVNWTKNGVAVSTNTTYTFNVTENATFVANFTTNQGESTQTSNFAQGYNWWSTYIEQNGIDGLGMLEEALGDNGLSIRSPSSGYNDYYAGYGWYGSLSSINNESSYRVITSAPCSITMTGNVAVPSEHPITVSQGWTWIGYLPSTSMDVNEALEGMEANPGDRVKYKQGYSDYYANYGWFGSLSTIEPGMGLMYYSTNSEPVTFTYPDSNRGGALRENLTSEHNHWVPNIFAYPDNMTITAVIELNDVELKSENYELAAFANGECRGSVRLKYVEPLTRYIAFLTIAGDEPAELQFSLYHTETGTVAETVNPSLQYETNAIVGSLDEPYTIHFRGTTGVDEWTDHAVIGDKLYVKSPNKEGFVIISDMLGRVVFNQQIGEACVIDLKWLAPNTLYVIKVNNQSLKFIRR